MISFRLTLLRLKPAYYILSLSLMFKRQEMSLFVRTNNIVLNLALMFWTNGFDIGLILRLWNWDIGPWTGLLCVIPWWTIAPWNIMLFLYFQYGHWRPASGYWQRQVMSIRSMWAKWGHFTSYKQVTWEAGLSDLSGYTATLKHHKQHVDYMFQYAVVAFPRVLEIHLKCKCSCSSFHWSTEMWDSELSVSSLPPMNSAPVTSYFLMCLFVDQSPSFSSVPLLMLHYLYRLISFYGAFPGNVSIVEYITLPLTKMYLLPHSSNSKAPWPPW